MKRTIFPQIFLLLITLFLVKCSDPDVLDDTNQMGDSEFYKKQESKKDTEACATIKDGTILDEFGNTIFVGFNQTGYNYQAKTYSGEMFPDTSPGWHLKWKWNDAYLSTQDCDGDNLLDIANGMDSYRGSGAWTTTKWTKTYTDKDGNKCQVSQFTKYVAVPVDAYKKDGIYFDASGQEIGQVVNSPEFEDFAKVQLIWNDPCRGINGVDYKAPGPVGLGNR